MEQDELQPLSKLERLELVLVRAAIKENCNLTDESRIKYMQELMLRDWYNSKIQTVDSEAA